MGGNCLLKNIVYQAKITPHPNFKNFKEETYIGLTSTTFKARLANNKSCFKNISKRNSCKLAEHIWKLQDNSIKYDIEWKLICRANTFSTISNTCNLCINEKMYILYFPEFGSLNSRSELTTNCRHRSNLLLDKTWLSLIHEVNWNIFPGLFVSIYLKIVMLWLETSGNKYSMDLL